MGRTCSSGASYAAAACVLGTRYGLGTLLAATDSDAALRELKEAVSATPGCDFVKIAATQRLERDDAAREATRIEDLLGSGALDAAAEFAEVLVDVFLLADADAYPRTAPKSS